MPPILDILRHTPVAVFVLLAGLLGLGLTQCFAREVRSRRVLVMGLAMASLSFYGVLSTFAGHTLAVPVWLGAAVVSYLGTAHRAPPAGTRYDVVRQRFSIPGSVIPLILILAVFLTKYAVGVALVLHPELVRHAPTAWGISALYGLFSGLFAGRAMRLLHLARRTALATTVPTLPTPPNLA
ncbi:DUF6622 family protein [Hydrogenophaga electricum]|uniref:Uncharacterized protein n=1 Tax=Hydrogenophaga electricum TaxID=1230953 RepID=A0ABQ6C2C7_9BURK|nr:DUF6622 family protein [Hydrogenophaga electricum]GLS13154.1 hypothetical protein GCM10007935_05830 [Hydrogenophaga electricum]